MTETLYKIKNGKFDEEGFVEAEYQNGQDYYDEDYYDDGYYDEYENYKMGKQKEVVSGGSKKNKKKKKEQKKTELIENEISKKVLSAPRV